MAKKPGVGYDSRKFGKNTALFLVIGSSSIQSRTINFDEDPWAGGLTKEKFEKRYGAGSADRHKWFGFDNEHKVNLVQPALQELFQKHPDVLQVADPASFDGNPTAMEVEDCAATNHTSLVVQARSLLQWSGTPENPIVMSDRASPERYVERSPLGLWDDHFFNLTPKPTSRYIHAFGDLGRLPALLHQTHRLADRLDHCTA